MNWEDRFKKFFTKESLNLDGLSLFIFMEDGIPVYGASKNLDKNAVGALMAGSWQAANALSSFIPDKKKSENEIFRFSFDTSERGVYILPFSIGKTSFLFGIIFKGQINPGQVKSRMRQILEKLLQHVENIHEESPPIRSENFLFGEISDREIDSLFSFEGK